MNRASSVRAYAGGKGLHVARAIGTLGEPATLVGVIDAAHRAFFEEALAPRGVDASTGSRSSSVRTCLAIREARGRAITEILEPGPEVDEAGRRAVCDAFLASARALRPRRAVGQRPARASATDVYARLAASLAERGVRCLVDASGGLLRAAAEARPFLVKPNREELEALLGERIDGRAPRRPRPRARCARAGSPWSSSPWARRARSLASGGRVCHAAAPPRRRENTVGSGDCLLGGVAVGAGARASPSTRCCASGSPAAPPTR